jgi:protein-S-isoprenylcysteine O-methyltransferase Ste14
MIIFKRVFVWAGGALFVGSLAACAYAYGVVWAAPGTGSRFGVLAALAADSLLFAIFALHHSLFARDRAKDLVARIVPPPLVRSVYVWTASALLLAVVLLWQPVGGDLYAVAGWPRIALAALQLAGVWFIARSVSRIDPLELAGITQGSRPDALQIAGPYRLVRHPLYLGWILIVFGAAHMTGDRIAFAAISTAYLVVAIPWEERSLRRVFGAAYADYQRAVRWRVIPFVY